jgi:pimeloyl-ACP methyl ester carboxylesterase
MTSHSLTSSLPLETNVTARDDRATKPSDAAPTRFLETAGGRIAYDDVGEGPLVVMVPSLGDIRQEYRFLRPRLRAAGYRAVSMDMRGHGESSVSWSDHSCSALGSDILALVSSLQAGPAILIGDSMGGGAVAWAAAEAPQLVDELVLIDPFVRAAPPASGLKWTLMKLFMAVAFNGPWKVWAWAKYYDSLYPTRKPADHRAYLKALSASLKEPGRFATVKAMMAASKADVEERLGDIAAPTLVVMGSKDPDFGDPKAEAELLSQLIDDTSVEMIEGAGHYPHAEMPDETANAIIGYLARTD